MNTPPPQGQCCECAVPQTAGSLTCITCGLPPCHQRTLNDGDIKVRNLSDKDDAPLEIGLRQPAPKSLREEIVAEFIAWYFGKEEHWSIHDRTRAEFIRPWLSSALERVEAASKLQANTDMYKQGRFDAQAEGYNAGREAERARTLMDVQEVLHQHFMGSKDKNVMDAIEAIQQEVYALISPEISNEGV